MAIAVTAAVAITDRPHRNFCFTQTRFLLSGRRVCHLWIRCACWTSAPRRADVKYSFNLTSQDPRRDLPRKIIIAQNDTETLAHVGLKLLGYLFFFRERLQLETRLPDENIAFVPDLAQLDYQLKPVLWVECGECSLAKLNKLAVKAPEAEIWVVKKSCEAAQETVRAMEREELRRNRYKVLGLDAAVFEEVCQMIHGRNELFWLKGTLEPPEMQFDLNGLWFEMPFEVSTF